MMEPLLSAVKKDKAFKGVFVPGSGGRSVKVLGYMDDVVLVAGGMCDGRHGRLQVSLFCSVPGMSVNWSKCQVCSGTESEGGEDGGVRCVF